MGPGLSWTLPGLAFCGVRREIHRDEVEKVTKTTMIMVVGVAVACADVVVASAPLRADVCVVAPLPSAVSPFGAAAAAAAAATAAALVVMKCLP